MGKHRSLRKNYISRLLLLGLVVVTSLLAGSVVPIRRQAPAYLVGGVLQTVTESSIEIADASYEVPASNAIIVAKTGANTPHCGSIASPCLSIQYAVNKAPGGGSVVVRAGEDHEVVSINKPLTLQPYQNEKVWLKGSEEVTGWVQEGSVWRRDNWNYLWKTSGGAPIGAAISSNYIDDAHPMAGWPDMVFNDGISLTQVATKAEVSAGKFFV